MQINLQKLREHIKGYKHYIQSEDYQELYKWEAVKNFHANWEENPSDVKSMLESCLQASNDNLWMGNMFFLKRMLLELADADSVEVLVFMKMLFDEQLPLKERAFKFQDGIIALGKKHYPGKAMYHDDRAVMLYLGLKYPDKYPLYKLGMFKAFASLVDYKEPIKRSTKHNRFVPVIQYLELCELIRNELEKDTELLAIHRSLLNPDIHFTGNYLALLTQDFIYCTAENSGLEIEEDENDQEEISTSHEPTYWLIAPGENARLWDDFYKEGIVAIGWDHLGDLRDYLNKEAIAERLTGLENVKSTKTNDALACWEFANEIKPGDVMIAKQGKYSYVGWGIVESEYYYDPTRNTYRHVRLINWRNKGLWKESEHPIVTKTLTNITKYPEYVKRLNLLIGIDIESKISQNGYKNYWWLNANPKIWSIDETAVGEVQHYTSHNEKSNKRQKYKYFTQVQPGDLVIGYETSPVLKVKAIFEITSGLYEHPEKGEVIEFQKKEDLQHPIGFDYLKSLASLRECEPLINNQGSLFRLTEEEFEVIQDIIDTQKLEAEEAEKKSKPYIKADALQELFMPEAQFDRIVQALKYKKNVILQGAPGVGKTYVAKRIAKVMLGKDDPRKIKMIQFHQSYSYEDFVIGIRPDGEGGFDIRKGLFYNFCERAQADPSSSYCLIIDEINRGNLSKIFGELMLLLEADKRGEKIQLTYSQDEEEFQIPPNLYLIGTMNTADRSLAMVDYALRRRFAFIDLEPTFNDKFSQFLQDAGVTTTFASVIVQKIKNINEKIAEDATLGKGFTIGHSYFCQLEQLRNGTSPEDWYKHIIELEIAPQLREYWFDNEDNAKEAIAFLLNI